MFFSSCSKDDDMAPEETVPVVVGGETPGQTPIENPEIPETLEIDIDDDGEIDFAISYTLFLIFSPDTDKGIMANFAPLGENEVLASQDGKGLFLRDLDRIEEGVADPLFWSTSVYGHTIVSINNDVAGEWPEVWALSTDDLHASYFMGLKLIDAGLSRLAWVELEIDTSSGAVSVLDKGMR